MNGQTGEGGDLLASDLDGTLVPPTWTPERADELNDFRDAIAAGERLWLAYVTGRHLEHALEAMDAFALPRPHYLVCEVGAALYARNGEGYREDTEFRALMASSMGTTGDKVRQALAGLPGLEPQSDEHQGAFKASFVTPWPPPEALLAKVHERLEGVGARTTLVTSRSSSGDAALLDVLPRGGAKDRAVRYLIRKLEVEERRTLFAGDSGNDRTALLADTMGVVVGNASRSFADEVRSEAEREGRLTSIHFAARPYAGGVLEGMYHFGIGVDAP